MDIHINDQALIDGLPDKYLMLTEKNKAKFKEPVNTIIIHYTAGSSAASSANWLSNPTVQASAHIIIGRAGEIYQLVPFDTIAWHAGQSEYGGRKYFNNFSIGIELDNPGVLTKTGDDFMASFGRKYPASEVVHAVHRNETTPRYWALYTETQIEACEQLCLALLNKYPSILQILGHEEISPGRKVDPGPAFPLDTFREKLLQHDRKSDLQEATPAFTDGLVLTDKLNIREGAGTQFEKIAKPLPRHKEVTVLGESNGWYRVKVDLEGWVSKAYIGKK